MKKIVMLIILFAVSIGCSKDDKNSPELKIRLSNISQFDFQNIKVYTSASYLNYGSLKAGKKSDYKVFKIAERYAHIELVIDGKTYTIKPVESFGEPPMTEGNYTYQINANNSENQFEKLNLELIRE